MAQLQGVLKPFTKTEFDQSLGPAPGNLMPLVPVSTWAHADTHIIKNSKSKLKKQNKKPNYSKCFLNPCVYSATSEALVCLTCVSLFTVVNGNTMWYVGACGIAHWRSEGNFVELVLSFDFYVYSGGPTQVVRSVRQAFY